MHAISTVLHTQLEGGLTDELVLEEEDGELRVDENPDVDRQRTPDDDDEGDPSPVPNVHPDEQVRNGDGANGDSRSEFPDAKVVAVNRIRGRVGVDEVGDEEAYDRLVEPVEHESEEDGSTVLDSLDASLVELRERLRRRRADVLVKLEGAR